MKPISNVTLVSDGVGYRSELLVDGFPMRGATLLNLTVAPNDLVRATVELVGIGTGDRAEVDPATPIYDQLLREWRVRAAVRALHRDA